MQEWKIKRMSVKLLEKFLEAISKLLSHYLGIHRLLEFDACPLCFVECVECLWFVIERKGCVDFMAELYPGKGKSINSVIDMRKNLRFSKWKKARISQLMDWEKIITLELERRKNAKRKS